VIASDIQVYNNTASTFGGGVRLFGSRLSLENSDIHDNTAPLGGGVYGTSREYNPDEETPVLDLTSTVNISDNQALTGDGQGGGIYPVSKGPSHWRADPLSPPMMRCRAAGFILTTATWMRWMLLFMVTQQRTLGPVCMPQPVPSLWPK
jgi:hypothetical protein